MQRPGQQPPDRQAPDQQAPDQQALDQQPPDQQPPGAMRAGRLAPTASRRKKPDSRRKRRRRDDASISASQTAADQSAAEGQPVHPPPLLGDQLAPAPPSPSHHSPSHKAPPPPPQHSSPSHQIPSIDPPPQHQSAAAQQPPSPHPHPGQESVPPPLHSKPESSHSFDVAPVLLAAPSSTWSSDSSTSSTSSTSSWEEDDQFGGQHGAEVPVQEPQEQAQQPQEQDIGDVLGSDLQDEIDDPQDQTLLQSYDTHVARDIWQGRARYRDTLRRILDLALPMQRGGRADRGGRVERGGRAGRGGRADRGDRGGGRRGGRAERGEGRRVRARRAMGFKYSKSKSIPLNIPVAQTIGIWRRKFHGPSTVNPSTSQLESFLHSHTSPSSVALPLHCSTLYTVNGTSMTLSLSHKTPSKTKIPFLISFLSHHHHPPHGTFYTTLLRSLHQGPPPTQRREQMLFLNSCSLPLPRLLHSPLDCCLYSPHCQIPLLLPHTYPFLNSKKKLLTSHFAPFSQLPIFNFHEKFTTLNNPNSFGSVTGSGVEHESSLFPFQKILLIPRVSFFPRLPIFSYREKLPSLNNPRAFSSVSDSGVESDNDDVDENGDDDKGINGKSCADPDEVDRVCKVIDELFALDRNMEAVLDECRVKLSHDLVVDVLHRFRHARKPAFRFFCWAGKVPGFAHDSRTFNSMMSILGKTRQFETMVAMLEEMGEKAVLTMETFVIAIKAFAAAKERKKAVGVFDLMKKYKFTVDVDAVNFLLGSLGEAKLGKEAQVVFDKLRDRFAHNVQTYTILLNGWCKVRNLLEAGRVWNEMVDKGFKPDIVAHNVMLEGLLRCRKKSDAIKLFEVMKAKGPSPNVRSYTIIIRDLSKQKMMREAVDYFHEMIDRGSQPDTALYTCLITGFGRQKRMDMVYNLLKDMREKGFPPDGRTYNALIKLMTSQHMPDDAVRIYKKMIQSGFEPTIHTYNMIMKSYFVIRNYEMGRAVWDEMHHKGCCPDDNSYTVFIGGLIRLGMSDEACKYLEEMIEKGMKAPQLDYNKFAADFSKFGNHGILEELAQKMEVAGKFEVSNVLARWADMMKKSIKRRDPAISSRQFT
ncbi:hypothetical protein RIF29_40388 [Crotalaria pallida]|uniref:Pentatricopeptide repeat-containing protein n=1 Tax=Crotalaria pallida TaxID=3830 RepID=A0AAN9E9D0_CROPI